MNKIRTAAKRAVSQNYLKMLLYTLAFIVSNGINYYIWAILFYNPYIIENDFVIILLLAIILLLQFFISPISIYALFKVCFVIKSGKKISNKELFGSLKEKGSIRKIVLINFIPSLLNLFCMIFKYSNMLFFSRNTTALFITVICQVVIYYKLFISNYYFIYNNCTAKDAIVTSCRIMKNRKKTFFIFLLSFFGWVMLSLLIKLILYILTCKDFFSVYRMITFKAYDPFIDLLGCCFYGVGLYLFPYFITSKFFLCDEILEDSKKYFLLKNNY